MSLMTKVYAGTRLRTVIRQAARPIERGIRLLWTALHMARRFEGHASAHGPNVRA